ncbi:hypothetical protein ACA910_005827 [Epithemia clementina (nom. ined.)]
MSNQQAENQTESREVEVWICDICKTAHGSREGAVRCEELCQQKTTTTQSNDGDGQDQQSVVSAGDNSDADVPVFDMNRIRPLSSFQGQDVCYTNRYDGGSVVENLSQNTNDHLVSGKEKARDGNEKEKSINQNDPIILGKDQVSEGSQKYATQSSQEFHTDRDAVPLINFAVADPGIGGQNSSLSEPNSTFQSGANEFDPSSVETLRGADSVSGETGPELEDRTTGSKSKCTSGTCEGNVERLKGSIGKVHKSDNVMPGTEESMTETEDPIWETEERSSDKPESGAGQLIGEAKKRDLLEDIVETAAEQNRGTLTTQSPLQMAHNADGKSGTRTDRQDKANIEREMRGTGPSTTRLSRGRDDGTSFGQIENSHVGALSETLQGEKTLLQKESEELEPQNKTPLAATDPTVEANGKSSKTLGLPSNQEKETEGGESAEANLEPTAPCRSVPPKIHTNIVTQSTNKDTPFNAADYSTPKASSSAASKNGCVYDNLAGDEANEAMCEVDNVEANKKPTAELDSSADNAGPSNALLSDGVVVARSTKRTANRGDPMSLIEGNTETSTELTSLLSSQHKDSRQAYRPMAVEESEDWWHETLRLERELMAKIDDEITAEEEVGLMQRYDDDITKNEEIDMMKQLGLEIAAVEERDRDEAKKRPADVVPLVDRERIVITPKRKKINSRGPIVETRVATFTKLVPRQWNGVKFMDHEDMKDFIGFHKSLSNCYAKLESIKGDSNSWWLTMYTGSVEKEECIEQLREWMRKMLFRLNMSLLEEFGTDLQVDIDTTQPIRARLFSFYDKVMLTRHPIENCSVEELRPALLRGGFLITQVGGLPCTSIDDFKTYKANCEAKGSKLSITGKQPNPEIQLYHEADPGSNAGKPNPTDFSVTENDQIETIARSDGAMEIASGTRRNWGDTLAKAAYMHFEAKYKPVAAIEYKNAGIQIRSTISSMWNQHKRMPFGKRCDERCECVFLVDVLTRNVVRDKLKPGQRWNNPLKLKAGDVPFGFAKYFCPRFKDLLRDEYKNDLPSEILHRLCEMWRKHERTLNFGTECSENCECSTGWESVFNKGQTPDEISLASLQTTAQESPMLHSDPVHCSSDKERNEKSAMVASRSVHDLWDGSCIIQKAQGKRGGFLGDAGGRVEYVATFDTSEPMGFYFVNKTENDGTMQCKVESVCPKTAKNRDDRIQKGTTVVAVETEDGRVQIFGWEKLKDKYLQAKRAGESLRVIFINRLSLEESVIVERYRFSRVHIYEHWNKNGSWMGSQMIDGWAGGAPHVNRNTNRSHSRRKIPSTNPGNSEKKSGEGSRNDKTDPPTQIWTMINKPRTLKNFKPRSILVKNSDPALVKKNNSVQKRRVQFNDDDDEREFDFDSAVGEFYVTLSYIESPQATEEPSTTPGEEVDLRLTEKIRSAIESGSYPTVLECFNAGAANRFYTGAANGLLDLRALIASRVKSGDHAFEMTDKILKVFINTAEIAKPSRVLKDWVDFECYVDNVDIAISHKAVKKQNFALGLRLKSGRSRQWEELALIEVASISPELEPAIIHCNMQLDRLQIFEIQLVEKTTGVLLGYSDALVQEIVATILKSKQALTRKYHLCSGIEATLRFQRHFSTHAKKKRTSLCLGVHEIVRWIDLFNEEEKKKGENRCYFSYEVPIAGATLLYIAVLLAEKPLVEMLLKRGAIVSSAVLQLRNRKDGYEKVRQMIFDVLMPNAPKHALETDCQQEKEQEVQELGGSILDLPKNWLFRLERSRECKSPCTHFERDGFCQRGKTCWFAHVHDEGTSPSIHVCHRFDNSLLEIVKRQDHLGNNWCTAGYIDGNDFFYPNGGDGVKSRETGVWWYRTEESANRAIHSAVTGVAAST